MDPTDKYNQAHDAFTASLPGVSTALDRAATEAFGAGLNGRVVLVTGAGSGLGRAFAIAAASHGAKVYISDISQIAVQKTRRTINDAGKGKCVVYPMACDTSSWEAQVDMFKHARKCFEHIDVVVPNAGVGETGMLLDDKVDSAGDPLKPNLLTLNVNLVGVIYTTKLAFFHLRQNPTKIKKSIVFVGSMASLSGLPLGTVYGGAKHGVLGIFRSVFYNGCVDNINTNMIAPWFVDTKIIAFANRIGLFGLPLGSIEDVVAAMIRSAADPDFNGNTVAIDAKGILKIPWEATTVGPDGYFAEFERRAVMTITMERKAKDLGLIFRHGIGLAVASRWVQAGLAVLLLAFAIQKAKA